MCASKDLRATCEVTVQTITQCCELSSTVEMHLAQQVCISPECSGTGHRITMCSLTRQHGEHLKLWVAHKCLRADSMCTCTLSFEGERGGLLELTPGQRFNPASPGIPCYTSRLLMGKLNPAHYQPICEWVTYNHSLSCALHINITVTQPSASLCNILKVNP